MKYSHTDNGGKYIWSFDEYCKDHGIKNERIVPKTPQHNGIVERMSRTIKMSIACMLSHVELAGHFGRKQWGLHVIQHASVIEILVYAAVRMRFDISHAIGIVSRFLFNPHKAHWKQWSGFSYISGVPPIYIYD